MADSEGSTDARDRIGGFAIVRGPGRALALTRSRRVLPLLWWVSIGGMVALIGATAFVDELVPGSLGVLLGLGITLAGTLSGIERARADSLPVVRRHIRFPGIRIERTDRDEAVVIDGARIAMDEVRGPVVIDERVRADARARRSGVPDMHEFLVCLATSSKLFHVARFRRQSDAMELAELLREGTGGPAPPVSSPVDRFVIWNGGGFSGVILGIAAALLLGGFQFVSDPVTRVLWTAVGASALIGLAFLSRFLVARVGRRRAAAYAMWALDSFDGSGSHAERSSKTKKKRRRPR